MDTPCSPRWLVYLSSSMFLAFTVIVFWCAKNWSLGWLCLISGLFGFILKYWGLGFTCAFRRMVTNGDMSQFRNLLVMLFCGTSFCSLYEAFQSLHPLFDQKLKFADAAAPVGMHIVIGSFLFGIGMQLGSGCATGTFVGIGEGFIKSYIVLPFFVIGATIATTDRMYEWWSHLPQTPSPVKIDFGFTLLILIVLFGLTFVSDYIRCKYYNQESFAMSNVFLLDLSPQENQDKSSSEGSEGKWYLGTLAAGAIGVLISLFYLCTGDMIGVMGVFPKVGASILKLLKVQTENWNYFKANPLPENFLDVPVFDSNLFIALGAFIASSFKGNFGKSQQHGIWEYTKGIIGGLLMGIGARMSNGCNIGSMTSGITSSSVHGFVWMLFAVIGSLVVCQGGMMLDKYWRNKKAVNVSFVTYTNA